MAIKGAWLRIATGGAFALIALQCSKASAQDAGAPDPQGIALGGFRLYPQLKVTTYYDDNVFLSTTDPKTDAVQLINATAALRSNWSSNKLDLDAASTFRRFDTNAQQDTNEYEGGADGRLDFSRSIQIEGSARGGRRAEVQGTPGDEGAFGRYRMYDFIEATAGVTKAFNRLIINVAAQADNFRYSPLDIGGTTIDQSALDRNVRGASAVIQYNYSSITVPYIAVSYSSIKYVHPGDVPPQSSTGFSILFGTSFEITRLFYGKVALGYQKQTFDDPAYPNFTGLNFQADITYKPTLLDTLHFTARRAITNSGLVGVPGVQQSEFALDGVHELTRQMSIDATLIYDREIYRGIDRQQDRYTAAIALRRTLNEYLAVSLGYQRLEQRSSGIAAGQNYNGNRVSLTLIAYK